MKKIVGLVVVLAIIAIGAVAPYVIGKQLEGQFRQFVSLVEARSGVSIEIVSYDRNWLDATAVTRLTGEEEHSFTLRHTITHGPFATFGLGQIKTVPQIEDMPESMRQHFDEPIVSLVTYVGFGGGYDANLTVASPNEPFSENGSAIVDWEGIEGQLHYSDHHAQFHLTVDSLEVKDSGKHFMIKGLDIRSSGVVLVTALADGHTEDWSGQSAITLDHFKLVDQSKGVNTELSLTFDTTSGLGESGAYGITSHLRIHDTQLDVGNQPSVKIDNAKFKFAFKGIPTDEVKTLMDQLRQFRQGMASSQSERAQKMLQKKLQIAFVKFGKGLLSATPKLVVAIPEFESSRGNLGMQVTANLKTTDDAPNFRALAASALRRLTIDAQAFLGKKLMGRVVAQSSKSQKVLKKLNMLLARNLIVEKADRYRVQAHYDKHGLTINGQPRPKLLKSMSQ